MDVICGNAATILTAINNIAEFLAESLDMSKYIAKIKEYKKFKSPSDDSLESYTKLMGFLHDIDELVKNISTVVVTHDNHSETFILNHKALVNKLNVKYVQFTKDLAALNPDIIKTVGSTVFDDIAKTDNKLDKIVKLRELYYKNPAIISLYAYLMQRAINEFFSIDKSLVFKLTEFITEDKAHALRGNYKSNIPPKDASKKNPPQTRFGLLPVTAAMPLKELLKVILAEDNIAADTTNLEKLAKKHHIGFIVFTSIVNTPADYNISALTLPDVAKEYMQPDEYGITKKTIQRFTTLNTYGAGYGWSFSITTHNKTAEKFYIIETLDGDTYRCMAPWLQSTKYSVSKFRVKKIIDYDQTIPSRALEYHDLAIKQALPNMFTNKILALDEFDAKLENVQSGSIQHSVVDKVVKVASKLIVKTKFKSSNDVSNLLHEPVIVEAFISAVEQEFASDTNSFNGGAFPRCELASSFITALQTASRRFAREVHNGYSRNPLKDEDLQGDSKQVATDKIIEVLKNAVELVIKLDDNLFTSSYYKYLILNYNM